MSTDDNGGIVGEGFMTHLVELRDRLIRAAL